MVVVVLATACGGAEVQGEGPKIPMPDGHRITTNIEIAELEIGPVDRFTSCPPSGELGQGWIPPLAPWTPTNVAPAAAATAAPPRVEEPAQERAPDLLPITGRSATEKAIHDTYPDFRSCYHRGLIKDPTQDGRAAIVLRVGADGRVATVEAYGACDLSTQVVACMKSSAARLQFDPPARGSETITIPAVFTTRGGRSHDHPTENDAYTAAAYVAFEGLRPALHACEKAARKMGAEVEASATLGLEVDGKGKVLHTNVDPWSGNQELLACAANAIGELSFPAPPAGRAKVLARLSFNPRTGTK